MNRIAELRKLHKISQGELGKAIGAAQNTVSNWEKGNRDPDNDTIKKIAEYFGVTTDYILGVENDDKTNLKFALFGTSDIDDEVLDDVKKYAAVARRIREEQKGH